MNGDFLATIVTQTGGQNKSALLSGDAPTIIEEHDNPIYESADKDELYEDFKPIEKQYFTIDGKSLPDILSKCAGDKIEMKSLMKVIACNFYEDNNGAKKKYYTLKIVAAKI